MYDYVCIYLCTCVGSFVLCMNVFNYVYVIVYLFIYMGIYLYEYISINIYKMCMCVYVWLN